MRSSVLEANMLTIIIQSRGSRSFKRSLIIENSTNFLLIDKKPTRKIKPFIQLVTVYNDDMIYGGGMLYMQHI